MAETRTLIKVFLGSPGDLSDERKAAKAVVDDVNSELSKGLACHVELVGWEDTLPGMGRPQEIINRELDGCDVFVGMIWKRWGTPPGGDYTSGFEEEFYRAVRRHESDGQPAIHMFFKEIDPQLLEEPGPTIRRVREFRDKVFSERKLLAGTFLDKAEFEKKLRKCVIAHLIKLKEEKAEAAEQKLPQVDATSVPTASGDPAKTIVESPFGEEGLSFLRDLAQQSEQGSIQSPMLPAQIARLRLLGTIVGVPSNDVASLGSHDANLIFKHRDLLSLGHSEEIGLFDAGLDHFSNENAPIWHWLAVTDAHKAYLLQVTTVVGPTHRRVNALKAMCTIAMPLEDLDAFRRDTLVKRWLDDEESSIRVAALNYLSEFGLPSDMRDIRQEYEKNETQTNSAAVEALLKISARNDRLETLTLLQELQPANIDEDFIADVFKHNAEFDDAILESLLSHRNVIARKEAFIVLQGRHKLDLKRVEPLLNDPDAELRLWALLECTRQGRTYSLDEAKSILVRPSKGGVFSVGASTDREGEAALDNFKREAALTMSSDEAEAASSVDIFDQNAFFAFVLKDYKRRADLIREAISDRFAARFSMLLNNHVARFGSSETTEKIRGLEDWLCTKFRREALDIVCGKKSANDISLVRTTLQDSALDFSPVDLEYLSKFGQWADVKLILEILKRRSRGASALSLFSPVDGKYELASKAILKLGRGRLSEIVQLDLSGRLLSQLIKDAPDNAFSRLSPESIGELLRSKHDDVRKNCAIKCIKTFSSKKLRELLKAHFSSDTYFYNVVHWLDLGTSCSREVALRCALRMGF
ncbi:DUF4062 domain-containing protein [Hydrogenophaga aromaticivorans]|uniref:DUF4062 domain-containing protein n=1 Tax=Hydrogenophaga aromaticivorans TaxID=2610898 RepID=UPI001B3810B9|nr:DUF4062 domain-containing protein [Hydrogenophaga aromaticivorans]MBQ0917758.1 DUF4062 domain-containing protein [Hydrogenophaga aromaticivorans]